MSKLEKTSMPLNTGKWKILAQTRNGRAIYLDPEHPQELCAGYNAADHMDAYHAHMDYGNKTQDHVESQRHMQHAMEHLRRAERYQDEFVKSLEKLKEKILLKAGENDDDQETSMQDYGLSEEDLEGMQIHGDPHEEDDAASTWLKEQEDQKEDNEEEAQDQQEEKPEEKKVSRSSLYSDWQPKKDYKPEHQEAIDKFMKEGYSHREAERLAGAHEGPSDFQSALSHSVRPSQPSDKMLSELKELASPWLKQAERHSKLNADPERNPHKYAAGQMMQAHEEVTKDYNKAYHDFLSSDDMKDLKGRQRHKAIREWKNEWHSKNPEYKQSLSRATDAQKHYKEAGDIRQKSLQDRIHHITTGGVGMPIDTSASEAAQHVGGQKTDQGYTSSTAKDPSVSFAQQNPELLRVLQQKGAKPEQIDRFHRINTAKASPSVKVRKKVDK